MRRHRAARRATALIAALAMVVPVVAFPPLVAAETLTYLDQYAGTGNEVGDGVAVDGSGNRRRSPSWCTPGEATRPWIGSPGLTLHEVE